MPFSLGLKNLKLYSGGRYSDLLFLLLSEFLFLLLLLLFKVSLLGLIPFLIFIS